MTQLSVVSDHQTVLKEIGDRLKELRIKAGYHSYESFATAFGLSRMQYWRIEKGKTNITIKSLLRLLDIHKISMHDFCASENRGGSVAANVR